MAKMDKKITRQMAIEEIFSSFPGKGQHLAQEITSAGLHCVGCHAATYETLEVGMLGHGFSEEDIDQLVIRLNAILDEEYDDSTITMTQRAAERFRAILKQKKKEGWALRFEDKPGGCGGFEYVLDFSQFPNSDDQVFESCGVEIHVKKSFLPRLIGSQIDYLEGLMGTGFKVTNSRVKGSCSCGQSHNY
ncbi:MAG: iron-sulfur cluster assembly accessory protein [Chlamydiota bacterium]